MHTLANLVGTFPLEPITSDQGGTFISALVTDSRKALSGCLFFAIAGDHSDGHDYIPQVLAQGAQAIVHEKILSREIQEKAQQQHTVLIRVEQSRRVLSHASAVWFDRPAQKLSLIGVTGTDGKSSTVFFVHQLLRLCGIKSGFFSTVALQTADRVVPNGLRQSTPEAPELHEVLAKMVEAGCTHGVIETTSHGLSHKTSRLRDVPFGAGIFTNLSHEHLEFHGSYEQYRSDKANLFRELSPPGSGRLPFAILNASDPEYDFFLKECRCPVLSYSSETAAKGAVSATLRATHVQGHSDGCSCTVHYDPSVVAGSPIDLPGQAFSGALYIPLPGTFNIENTLAALLCVAVFLNTSPLALLVHLKNLRGGKR